MPSINWVVVVKATVVGLAVAAIPSILVAAIVGDDSGRAVWLYLVIALAGFFAAGGTVGVLERSTPVLHGAVAGLGTSIVLQVVGAARRTAADGGIDLTAAAVTVLLAACLGVGGALATDWLLRRRSASPRTPRQPGADALR